MKCPGCGAELIEGNDYCKACGGKIEGSSIDYTHRQSHAAEVYEEDYEDDSVEFSSSNPVEETFVDVMWGRLIAMLYVSPIAASVFLLAAYLYDRPELYFIGAVFVVIFVGLARLYLKYALNPKYNKKRAGSEMERDIESSPPRFSRKV